MPVEESSRSVIARDARSGAWLLFRRPQEVLCARTAAEVVPVLDAVETAVTRHRLWAAGFVAYEAAAALDPVLEVRGDDDFPRVWMALFREPERLPAALLSAGAAPVELDWRPSLDPADHAAGIASIKRSIRAGETYQVNFTFRMRSPFHGDPHALFARLVRAQPTEYAAFVDAGRWCVVSASPELFLERTGREVVSRPMKGTAPRGLWVADDLERREALRRSEKDRAENVMIVDMVRNDLGRVADVGSVEVTRLCTAERFPTVWQLTSTVRARTGAGLVELLRAAFPPASITGAPKASTMSLIRQLETDPRRAYTGSVGFVRPGGDLQLNVAIRTVVIDKDMASAEYGVGGGIVWDSDPAAELAECRVKARVLGDTQPEFHLLESMLWMPQRGVELLERHLARLEASARYFGFRFVREHALREVEAAVSGLPGAPHKLRLELARGGHVRVTTGVVPCLPGEYRLALAREPVRSDDRFLYHKTTHREVYDRALADRPPGTHDVLLWNERGEITESCLANVLVERGGDRITPPVRCGLLPGVGRERLLEAGSAREHPVRVDELEPEGALELVNSVRGRWTARLISDKRPRWAKMDGRSRHGSRTSRNGSRKE